MKMRRFMALAMATVMGASLLTACGGGSGSGSGSETTTTAAATTAAETTAAAASGETEAAETEAAAAEKSIEPTTITFWHGMNNKQEQSLTELTDKFNAENEYGITVELVNQGSYSDLQTKLMANAAADTLPDIAQAYNNYFTDYVDKVVALDDFVANDYPDWDDILESYRTENSEYGKITGVPFNKSTYLFFYNKTMFDELGLEAPKTWEDLEHIGEVILAEKGLAAIGYDSMCDMLEAALRQHGEQYVDASGALFNTAGGLETLEFIMNLYNSGYARLVGEDNYFSDSLSNGMIGGYVGSSTGVSYISTDIEGKEFELGVCPVVGDKTNAAYNAGTNIVMFAKDENNQKAAWEYMKFMTSKESTIKWAMDTGYLPIRTSAYESDEYQEFMAGDITAQAAYEQAPYGFVSKASFTGSNEIRNVVSTTLNELITEKADAQTALDTLIAEINDVLQ